MGNYVEIAAKPRPFKFNPQRTALLVIDMQNDFCAQGGFGELLGNDITLTRAIIPTIHRLLEQWRLHNLLVIHTREGHLPDLSDCPPSKQSRTRASGAGIGDMGPLGRILIRGEHGHAIVDELTPLPSEIIIDKPGKGAFYSTSLEQILQQHGIESLIITGVTTHVCVHTTLREANDRGFECLVLEDATAAFEVPDHEDAIRMVYHQGAIFGWVTTTAKLMASMEVVTNREA